MSEEILVYIRVALCLLAAFMLWQFSMLHKKTRRARNLSLSLLFLTVVVSLITQVAAGLEAKALVDDWLVTPALAFYVVMQVIDFFFAGRNGDRKLKED